MEQKETDQDETLDALVEVVEKTGPLSTELVAEQMCAKRIAFISVNPERVIEDDEHGVAEVIGPELAPLPNGKVTELLRADERFTQDGYFRWHLTGAVEE